MVKKFKYWVLGRLVPSFKALDLGLSVQDEGKTAKELMENPIYSAALKLIETSLLLEWQQSNSTEKREQIFFQIQALQRIDFTLRGFVAIAQHEAEEKFKEEELNGFTRS